jgi:hypothetical protein
MASETDCTNELDDDCDGFFDCDDSNCASFPLCLGQAACGDGVCNAGERCQTCPSDCRSSATGLLFQRYCCGDGITQMPEAQNPGLCHGNN